MMEGLKKRTRKAFGIRKKEKDTDSTGSPDRDGIQPSPHEPPYNSKAECAREGGKKVSKKSNGAPNGFYAEIDWERYNSPELDEEGYSIRPEEPGSTKGKHFYSSSESEEEEESHKKFNIKIKPLQSKDILKNAATVDELKASIGNIALSPSPVGAIKRNLSSEEVARPRRSTPTPELISKKPPDDTTALAPLFGPPLESAFDEQKTEVLLDQPEIWGSGQPINPSMESPKLTRPFPTGTPPPLPPKNVPATPPRTGSPLTIGPGASSPARPATPLVPCRSTTPPPPPPRPPSRPKLPPGKPGVGDVSRPFSPPIHSSSPPPIAPLARAESTSSISSTNSLSAATTPTVENEQPSLVWFDRGKFYLTFEGSSRGPSPLTMGAQDTLPVAAAFTETVNAYFKGADPSKCIVKITGEMVLSFPAGITRHFANNPSPAALTFRVINFSRLEHVLPNPQLLCCDNTQNDANTKEFWVNMPNLMTHLKKVSEQKPQATYYNVDMLKYQVSAQGIQSTPLNLAVNWRCEPSSTDLRIDYKYNTDAMTTAVALNNVQFLVPIDGGVTKLQAVLPPAVWNAEQQRILWKIPDISQKSENGGVGSLLARFQLSEGPSKPSPLVVQFTSEGSTLSGCDIELVGAGYRFSLIKKRFAAGKYLADN
ncbi:SH3-containing GRB2-like protein 3-interacting protein 1 isoform X16 [Gorilla gorilla gorilla]|uniref:SH3-containing GRB2-like protein 3-interacting protein 1 n=1 Tax=Homo sapiens TaxID=9606 RepID=A0A804HHV6_HUMAN|nr:SH3-containing GRB2-like protein 3-interacting protein 1 isoform 12 [Homo sapiens]NP_001363478.1 SH3-containing GRB2-like protein 3-interacting protein 1 isoform 12 [Homo sapiens]XP_018874978.2 SH3-containing GRB2-like protein 3-interacting protein 1 isoform X18 [Gorilla gorilla gorilla]XP_047288010.1 SH3-containing GRB2-like protein 3-interacting protein 1 isoform X13 [Homo sapiens]XP_047288011.1 SH3-containing GRB2-like protein 3-interacting protein 1 isoform X13 [Homo sapiens]XP_05419512|eukprot:XP_016858015.1 SH3-containing GRB2-like protein 3-interacting protein 1 isoform X21 [Homo sapiens]